MIAETSVSTPSLTVEPQEEQVRCHHCGLPSEARFCCAGCESVYATIESLGLLEFYRWRDVDVGQVPQPAPSPTPELAEAFSEVTAIVSNGEARFVFELTGIHCAGCLWILEKLPRILQGVHRSECNLSTGELTVVFDPTVMTVRSIARFLDRLGYPPKPPNGRQIESTQHGAPDLWRIGVAGFAAMNTMMLAVSLFEGFFSGIDGSVASVFRWTSLGLTIPVVIWAAFPLYDRAFRALKNGQVHIELPLVAAIAAAFLLSVVNTLLDRPYVYFDSVCVLVFLLLVSRAIQGRALADAQRGARLGWAILPPMVTVMKGLAKQRCKITDLIPGDRVVVNAGDRFPADGVVEEGVSAVDRAILTGESHPIDISTGSRIEAGALNVLSEVVVRVLTIGSNTRVGRLLAELRSRGLENPPFATFTDVVGRWYLVALAVAAGFILLGVGEQAWAARLEQLLTLFAVTCPCALAFAVPTLYGMTIGQAARRGILIKSAAVLDALPLAKDIALDKTGTVTTGILELRQTEWLSPNSSILRDVLNLVTAVQRKHPVSAAIRRDLRLTGEAVGDARRLAGLGVELQDRGEVWRFGRPDWADPSVSREASDGLTSVVLSRNLERVAVFSLTDRVRATSSEVIRRWRNAGKRVWMLSGDQPGTVRAIGSAAGIDQAQAIGGLSPEEKAALVNCCPVPSVFIGDGVNDLSALRAATVGIALAGGLESTVESADVVVVDGALEKVAELMRAARRTRRVALIALSVSLVYNLTAAAVTVAGAMNPLVAAFLMPTSSLSVMALAYLYQPFRGSSR